MTSFMMIFENLKVNKNYSKSTAIVITNQWLNFQTVDCDHQFYARNSPDWPPIQKKDDHTYSVIINRAWLQADHSLVIQVYESRLTRIWIIYDFLTDHSKIKHEILYDWYGSILWSDYDLLGRETHERYPNTQLPRGQIYNCLTIPKYIFPENDNLLLWRLTTHTWTQWNSLKLDWEFFPSSCCQILLQIEFHQDNKNISGDFEKIWIIAE